MISRLVGAAFSALMIATLAGCGGGGGGGSSTPVQPGLSGGTILSITVNSPPVVTFVVKDSAGNPVTGLTLYKAGYDGHCGRPLDESNPDKSNYTANAEFAIAKFDGANWQSLISRQRYTTPSPGQNAVVEGTNDPVQIDATTTSGVGSLMEADGVYTYHFATDVTLSLLMANAADNDALDNDGLRLGKVANNGYLAVKDGKALHRVALQLCYVDPVTKETVKVNPFMDFTLGADGKGVPYTDGQGHLTPARKVVDRGSCNECHVNFAQHGGNRVDPNFCVMCHNPGSSDFETGNPIDFKLMVHKFHMGKRLTQDYAVLAAIARKDLGGGVIAGVLYPQDQRNCVKCHDGSASAAHKTAQGDNWKTKPSKNACFACHDNYKTVGSKWQLAHATYTTMFTPSVANPDNTPDAVCQSCHNDAGGGVAKTIAKAHEITEWVKSENYQYNIWGITKNPDNTVTVEYSVSNPKTGTDYNLMDFSDNYSITASGKTTKTFRFGSLVMLFGWNTADYANDGAIGRPWSSSCVTSGTPTCDSVTGLPKAGTAGPVARGQPVAINAIFDSSVQKVGTSTHFKLTSTVLPAAANGTLVVALQGRLSEQKDASSSWSVPVRNKVEYFAMNGTKVERRQVVSAAKCNACHGRNLAFTNVTTFKPGLGGHGGSRTDPEVCVICHNGNNPLNGTVVSGGVVTQYAESADFKRMIHMMHAEQEENYPVWPKAVKTTALGSTMYTGLRNCNVCHEGDSFKQSKSVLGTSVTYAVDTSADSTDATVTDTDASDNLVISPKASTCSSCHVSDEAKTHMINEGKAAFGTVTQGALATGTAVLEKCDGCHLPGALKPVDVVHSGN